MAYSPATCGSHPLDLIPVFRRWPRSPVRNLVYTGLWNTLIALFLTGAALLFDQTGQEVLAAAGLISNVVGYLIHGVLAGLDFVLRGWPSRARGVSRLMYHIVVISTCAPGPRLRYRVEALDAARAIRIAPMLLQPIVENAGARRAVGGQPQLRRPVQADVSAAVCEGIGSSRTRGPHSACNIRRRRKRNR